MMGVSLGGIVGWTFCSGIGAPEVAAPSVDWRLASEIEPFPREVLQRRLGYKTPEDHNQGDPLLWGDMTEVSPEMARSRGVPLPDLIVAGTPCQAFSIAGLRKGTADARGNLTLKFVEICHAIVDARPDGKLTVLWENVPGVLSDKGNAFGCFLGGLVGAVDALIPEPKPRAGKSTTFWKWKKGGTYEIRDDEGEPTGEFETVEPHHRCTWPSEGMVQGPRARAAWGVLDAQWFGVAQRRRRVFVVVDFGGCVDPAAILLEPDRLRGDRPPRREAGQDVAGTLDAGLGQRGQPEADRGHLVEGHHGHIAGTVSAKWSKGSGGPAGDETQNMVAFDCKGTQVQHDASGVSPPLRSMGHNENHQNAGGHAAVAIQERAGAENPKSGPDGAGYRTDDCAYTLEARNMVQSVAFDTTQITSPANVSNPKPGDPCHPLAAGAHAPALASGPIVRRLMPIECARLQGFPDNHCAITYRGKPAADGPQYKAFGNSMAVPCVGWILNRILVSIGGGQ